MKRGKGTYWFRRLGGEHLESRNMLAGHPLAPAFVAPAVSHLAAEFGSFFGNAFSGRFNFGSSSSGTVLSATLTDTSGGTGTGTVTYSTGTGRNGATIDNLTVSVTGEADDTTLAIAIGGVTVGYLTTGATGSGTLRLSESGFPTTVAAGDTVTIGTLSGAFATSTTGNGSGGGCMSSSSSLTASLTDSTNTSASGTATFTTTTSHGSTTTSLTITVTDSTPSSSLLVNINGASVGTLSTDSNGDGTLTISAGLPTVASGSTITVGTLSGSFASSTSGGITIQLNKLRF